MINQGIKYSLALSLLLSGMLAFFFSAMDCVALFLGTSWGALNLYLISNLAKKILIEKQPLQTFILILVKFPLLYLLGFGILSFPMWNPWFAAAGFPVIFLGAGFSLLWQSGEQST